MLLYIHTITKGDNIYPHDEYDAVNRNTVLNAIISFILLNTGNFKHRPLI